MRSQDNPYQCVDDVLDTITDRYKQTFTDKGKSLTAISQGDIDLLAKQVNANLDSILKTFRPAISALESKALRLEHHLATSVPHFRITQELNKIRGHRR